MTQIIRAANCGNCKFSRPVNNAPPGTLECRRNPPQVSAILIPKGPQSAELQFPAAFPIVGPHIDCGEHKPALVIQNIGVPVVEQAA